MAEILLIFVKNPQLGKVKTRLANTIGAAGALEVYHRLLERTRAAALETQCRRWVCYSDFIPDSDDWAENIFEKHLQSGPDLGRRMSYAFQTAFESGADSVLIIGSDCPRVTPDIIQEGFKSLQTEDFVIGPSTDGGYYLLGMQKFQPTVFQNIAWSTDTVCDTTLERIRALGGSCYLLPALTDIDTEADLIAVGEF